MKFIINEKGKRFFEKRDKDLFKYLYIAPIFLFLISVLFILGAKNDFHFYFSIFLIFIFLLIIVFGFISFAKKLNRTILKIFINSDGNIILYTHKVLFLKCIIAEIKINSFKLSAQKFQINKKETEEGWIIKLKNNKKLYLYKGFFDYEIIEMIIKYSR